MITPFRLFLSITCSPDFLLDFFFFIEFIDSNFNVDPLEKIEFERCFRPLSKEFFLFDVRFFFRFNFETTRIFSSRIPGIELYRNGRSIVENFL